MPILKNAIKKMRQDRKKAEANKTRRSAMRTAIKKALTTKSSETLNHAFSTLDKAAKVHLIHKSKANRLKSRLTKAISTIVNTDDKAKKTTRKTAGKKTATKAKASK